MRSFEIDDKVEVLSWDGKWVRGVVTCVKDAGGRLIEAKTYGGWYVHRLPEDVRHVSTLELMAEAQLEVPEAGNSSGEVPG